MIKPGSYLQWNEVDLLRREIAVASPILDSPIMRTLQSRLKLGGAWIPKILTTLQEEGFSEVESQLFRRFYCTQATEYVPCRHTAEVY